MTQSLDVLADLVERGQISRRLIEKQHGKSVAAAVRALLSQRAVARLSAAPPVVEDEAEVIFCCDCGTPIDEEEVHDWDNPKCSKCLADDERFGWLDETCAAVERLAAAHGWDFGGWQVAQTGSRYTRLERGVEAITVRVSDHGSAYCREDISIAKSPSGDDHSLETLRFRLGVKGSA